ncbi:MAG TPA: DUF2585 family protein [Planctomycetaceae bacterium]|jgi:hypothetical protein
MGGSLTKDQPSGVRRLLHMSWTPWLPTLLLLIATVFALRGEGRRWWCACGQANLWIGNPQSEHGSQHLFDPYSFTHILHGVLLCGVLAWIVPRLSLGRALAATVFFEALWEVLENSEMIIQRYRTGTVALGYEGDSVANSLGDILSCGFGFLVARRIGLRWSIALVVASELILLWWIRDNLTLNIVMLIWPIDAVKKWQTGT